jgi:hypothetical protein
MEQLLFDNYLIRPLFPQKSKTMAEKDTQVCRGTENVEQSIVD